VSYLADFTDHPQLNFHPTHTETQIPRSNQLPKIATASGIAISAPTPFLSLSRPINAIYFTIFKFGSFYREKSI
jgi:hypothetical protein